MDKKPFGVTVAIVTYRRLELLTKALYTLRAAIFRCQFPIEIQLLINGHDRESCAFAEKFQRDNPSLIFQFKNLEEKVTPAEARNILLKLPKQEWVFFMDDDIQVPEELLHNFKSLCEKTPSISVWGGPNLTPLESQQTAVQNGWFVENPLIVGPVAFRYRKRGLSSGSGGQFNLMLCNLFVKSEIFKDIQFSSHLKTAEENELFYQIRNKGGQLGCSDELFVWHERRSTRQGFLKQIFYYGFGRGQLIIHGHLKSQWYFGFFPLVLIGLMGALALFPMMTLSTVLAWLLVIKLNYVLQFKKVDLKVLYIPIVIWILYTGGLLKGITEASIGVSGERVFQK